MTIGFLSPPPTTVQWRYLRNYKKSSNPCFHAFLKVTHQTTNFMVILKKRVWAMIMLTLDKNSVFTCKKCILGCIKCLFYFVSAGLWYGFDSLACLKIEYWRFNVFHVNRSKNMEHMKNLVHTLKARGQFSLLDPLDFAARWQRYR